jgi:hypothetical protein
MRNESQAGLSMAITRHAAKASPFFPMNPSKQNIEMQRTAPRAVSATSGTLRPAAHSASAQRRVGGVRASENSSKKACQKPQLAQNYPHDSRQYRVFEINDQFYEGESQCLTNNEK